MTSALQQVAWDECLLAPVRDREAEAYLKREAGSAPSWVRYFLPCPWVAKTMIRVRPDNALLMKLRFHESDLVGLTVSQENSCRYCYAVLRAQLRLLGVNEERIQRMEQQLATGGIEPRTDAMLRYARRLCRASPLVTPADQAPMIEAGIGPDDAREVAYVAAAVCFMNRMGTIPALPAQPWEKAPDQIVVRLFRPLIGAMVRSWRKPGQPLQQPLHPEGPFAALIGVYGSSPIGRVLGDALRDMWGSAVLPRRVKALAFAVVAHGLGAENAKREATRVLAEEGMAPAEIAPLLANLGGPGLEATESAVLSFARDSIWYEPQQIQKRARQLHAQLTPPQFVEAIGVASLANTVCRLDAALVES